MNRAETTQRRGGRGLQPAAAPLEIDAGDASYVDEDDRTVSKSILLVSFFQIALCSFYYTVVIPTSRLYAESLDAPDNFQAYMVAVLNHEDAIDELIVEVLFVKLATC